MTGAVKGILAGSVLLVLAVGGELLWLHHRDAEDAKVIDTRPSFKADPDDLVVLKHEHPMVLKDEKDLKGRTIWVSAGGQMDYYPFSGGKVDLAKSEGVLLGAEPLLIKDAVEQAEPAKDAIRIPLGDKQIWLVFAKPGSPKEFATQVGYKKDGEYTFLTDDIYFYEDPHQSFSAWGPDVWKAIDSHTAQLGLSERQTQMALGQVSEPHGTAPGNRSVTFNNQGHPKNVTFVNNKATKIEDVKQ